MSGATFSTRKKINTFPLRIDLAIPPEKPQITGHIMIDAVIRSKPDVKALSEEGLDDTEYLPKIASAIHGLGHPETDEPLVGQAAFDEALNGHYSMYLCGAIVEAYFTQYGEARKGNSKRRR